MLSKPKQPFCQHVGAAGRTHTLLPPSVGGKEKLDEKIEQHDADDDADDGKYDHSSLLFGQNAGLVNYSVFKYNYNTI